jgi:hypothetical protein
MKNYNMYRYFKGEDENPFDKEKQNNQFMFWFYENHFDLLFDKYESSDWYDFFGAGTERGNSFMNLLSKDDYMRPTEKKKADIFDIWLNKYLFVDKLYAEWDNENEYKKAYYSTSVQ